MPGRRPLPTATRIAEGESVTRGRGHSRPIEGDDIQPDHVMPEMPKGMSKSARREWRRMSKILFRMGVLTEIDGKALAAYCEAYAQAEIALRDVAVNGQVTEIFARVKETGEVLEYNGKPVFERRDRNPSMAIYTECSKLMKTFLIEFGLTPASRSKLKLPVKQKEDELEKMMNSGRRLGFQPTVPADAPVNQA